MSFRPVFAGLLVTALAGACSLWIAPNDPSSIYVVTGEATERWPLDPDPAGCA